MGSNPSVDFFFTNFAYCVQFYKITIPGLNQFESSVKALSFSTIFESNQVFLASIDSDQTPNLRVWKGQFALEAGQNMAELVGETTAYSDFVGQAYFYPEPSNVLLTIGKSHVTMWNLGTVFQFCIFAQK